MGISKESETGIWKVFVLALSALHVGMRDRLSIAKESRETPGPVVYWSL
ncbi:MAG: hypothetical protein ABI679_00905 [Gemmatimonadota bacterium]